jgi:hypothetical protein
VGTCFEPVNYTPPWRTAAGRALQVCLRYLYRGNSCETRPPVECVEPRPSPTEGVVKGLFATPEWVRFLMGSVAQGDSID